MVKMGTYWHLCHFSDCTGHKWKTYQTTAKKIQTPHQTASEEQPDHTYDDCSRQLNDGHRCKGQTEIIGQRHEEEKYAETMEKRQNAEQEKSQHTSKDEYFEAEIQEDDCKRQR